MNSTLSVLSHHSLTRSGTPHSQNQASQLNQSERKEMEKLESSALPNLNLEDLENYSPEVRDLIMKIVGSKKS